MRNTISRPLKLYGVGLHTGAHTSVTLAPAASGHGIRFYRWDLPNHPVIPATVDSVLSTDRRTVVGSGSATVSTVEHLLAVIHAHQIDDLHVAVDGPEVPQLDGSAKELAAALARVGTSSQPGGATKYEICESRHLQFGDAWYRVGPSESLEIDVHGAWTHPLIGAQNVQCIVTPEYFDTQLAGARTFGFIDEMVALERRGLIRGVSPSSGIALSNDRIVHGLPLRWPDEFVRHKALDLIGDLALLGGVLTAKIVARRPSHGGNVALAKAIQRWATSTCEPRKVLAGDNL